MSRDVGDDQSQQSERRQAAERSEDLEQEPERSPQERVGNSLLSDLVGATLGASARHRAGSAGRDANPDDEVVVEAPAGPPEEAPEWTEVLFGHPDWVPPRRKHAPLGSLLPWLPPPLPDPFEAPPPQGAAGPPAVLETPWITPSLHVARFHAQAWLAATVPWLTAGGLHEAADLAGAGARRLAGPDASRGRVLAVRVSAASLGLAALGLSPRAARVRFDLEAGRAHLDLVERRSLEDPARVPSAAALTARALAGTPAAIAPALPEARHVPRGAVLSTWADLLALRGGTRALAPEDLDTADRSLGTQPAREALEDRAMAVYTELLRVRLRAAGGLELLAATAEPHLGDRVRPGLYATAAAVDRQTEVLLRELRRLGRGLYDADPWPLGEARACLVEVARLADALVERLLETFARWTARVIEPSRWPDAVGTARGDGALRDAVSLLATAQGLPPDRVPPSPVDAPWAIAAFALTAGDPGALAAVWTAGDPGAVAAVLAA